MFNANRQSLRNIYKNKEIMKDIVPSINFTLICRMSSWILLLTVLKSLPCVMSSSICPRTSFTSDSSCFFSRSAYNNQLHFSTIFKNSHETSMRKGIYCIIEFCHYILLYLFLNVKVIA